MLHDRHSFPCKTAANSSRLFVRDQGQISYYGCDHIIIQIYSKRDIPVVNYRMHTLHCARNVVLCPTCDEPVPKSGVEEHNLEFHTEKECDVCNEKMTPNIVEEHKVSGLTTQGVHSLYRVFTKSCVHLLSLYLLSLYADFASLQISI
jgi:hypothetical protein